MGCQGSKNEYKHSNTIEQDYNKLIKSTDKKIQEFQYKIRSKQYDQNVQKEKLKTINQRQNKDQYNYINQNIYRTDEDIKKIYIKLRKLQDDKQRVQNLKIQMDTRSGIDRNKIFQQMKQLIQQLKKDAILNKSIYKLNNQIKHIDEQEVNSDRIRRIEADRNKASV